VDKDVRLEVLDWGGSGRPVVLLAGWGNTAHIYDDFAPKLTAGYHVYGITRRGFGASSFSGWNYGADRLADDVIAVIDALKLNRPVLVGHSLAGQELSSIANRHPERVAGLVYLDAGYEYAFENGKGPSRDEFEAMKSKEPHPSPPSEPDLASFEMLQKWYVRTFGLAFPEGELHQIWDAGSDGHVGKVRNSQNAEMIFRGMRTYTDIPVPTLAIFAIPHRVGIWINESADPEVRKASKAYSVADVALTGKQVNAFDDGVPTAHVVRLKDADHFVFLSNEADVLRELRSFIKRLH